MVPRPIIISTDPRTAELRIANAFAARGQLKALDGGRDEYQRVWVLDPRCRDPLVPILQVCFGLRVVELHEYMSGHRTFRARPS
jgi:hypothetical protein